MQTQNRKRLVANQSRREGVYNRAGDVSGPFAERRSDGMSEE